MTSADLQPESPTGSERGGVFEVFWAFLRLGSSSFGGPIAHIGYFHAEFVERRRWLTDSEFSRLLALAQFLPGPASSQLGFAIGLRRAGLAGAVAAFVAFTLPSALLLFALAVVGASLGGPWWEATLHALKLVAVVVVADGLWRMARQLTPDASRLLIAAAAAALILATGLGGAQLLAIALGAVAGMLILRPEPAALPPTQTAAPTLTAASGTALALFGAVLLGAVAFSSEQASLASIAAAFARAGSLVFGGGHVVLPLLEQSVVAPGWIGSENFLTGYGAAQAVPGPMFSLAAYLGALIPIAGVAEGSPNSVGAVVATLAIFLPGFLLLYAVLPVWDRLLAQPVAQRAVGGVNAAVVGLLAAAFYSPVVTSGIVELRDVGIVAIGFALQHHLRRPTLWVLGWCIGTALLLRAL